MISVPSHNPGPRRPNAEPAELEDANDTLAVPALDGGSDGVLGGGGGGNGIALGICCAVFIWAMERGMLLQISSYGLYCGWL